MYPIWHLTDPDVTREPSDPSVFYVKGWIAVESDPVERLAFEDPALKVHLPLTTRRLPDAEGAYGLPTTAFEAAGAFDLVKGRDSIFLSFRNNGADYRIVVPVRSGAVDRQGQKARKLARIAALLQCPRCRCGALRRDHGVLTCPGCCATYPAGETCYDFLADDFRDECGVVDSDLVSSNLYDGLAMNFVHAHRRGLILDCGAGRREACFENVVTLDVSADATTDVRGVAERLPFVNDCFDAVFSFAVLEHVKDPMRCAREMIRVLKPGHDYLGRPFVKCLADATRTELACCNTLIGVKPLEGERK